MMPMGPSVEAARKAPPELPRDEDEVMESSSSAQTIGDADEEMKPAWVDGKTMRFPQNLPMQLQYEHQAFYVRNCYDEYYRHVLKKLESNTKVITVTGTSGVGMSVFFGYFFTRYTQDPEHQETTIIMASFDDKSKMRRAVIWKSGKYSQATLSSEMEALIASASANAGNNLLHLYDGPPDSFPSDGKIVCFTSQDDYWFNCSRKWPFQTKCILPPWDLFELLCAAKLLGLLDAPRRLFTVDEVKRRFFIFGGSARECLCASQAYVKEREREMTKLIATLGSIDHVKRLLDHERGVLARPLITRYVPVPDEQGHYTIAEASAYVRRLLVERLMSLIKTKRDETIAYLKGNRAAASYRGSLFEAGVHEKLRSECQLSLQGLDPSLQSLQIKIERSSGDVHFAASELAPSILSGGPYHIPLDKNFPAIDSFYYAPPKWWAIGFNRSSNTDVGFLWLFQVTVSKVHPICGQGLHDVLHRLELDDLVTNKRVALVFVVPVENEASFRKQKICLEDESSDGDSVEKINGIGKVKASALKHVKDAKITTIGDLRAYLKAAEESGTSPSHEIADKCSLSSLRRLLVIHDERQNRSHKVNAIPQYVCAADIPSHYSVALE